MYNIPKKALQIKACLKLNHSYVLVALTRLKLNLKLNLIKINRDFRYVQKTLFIRCRQPISSQGSLEQRPLQTLPKRSSRDVGSPVFPDDLRIFLSHNYPIVPLQRPHTG